jgi:ATP-dependent Clp protease ATP-binding subunit ClpA
MYNAGLAPDGRPVSVFLLLGPTGTGKTRTVEALAEVLHGSRKHMVRVDCGEYQMDHEVAKLIGAPPGYLGHRETHPILTQAKLASVTSEKSSLSIILFDEIEKAAPSLNRLLLGVLDKATLRLGDNNVVNFERSLIFLTSNLGAHGMMKELAPGFGFAGDVKQPAQQAGRLENIAMAAVRRNFSPEFVNRIDATVTYQPLSTDTLSAILAQQINDLQAHIENRLGSRGFRLTVSEKGRKFLLEEGASTEYGARELKRAVHKQLTQPLAEFVVQGRVKPGGSVRVDYDEHANTLRLKAAA